MVRLRAQIRTENVGLKRSHLEMIDENMYDAGASKAHEINQQAQPKQAKTSANAQILNQQTSASAEIA